MLALLVLAPGVAAVPPDITVQITGTLGSNGWYVTNVTVDWDVSGETSSSGCDTVTLILDTPGTLLTCSAENNGDATSKSVTIKLDKTAPAATATADRLPDSNGWYNRPLTVTSSGTDLTSGIAACSSSPYAGPDSSAAIVNGACHDAAGNTTPTAFAFKYDGTAPSLTGLRSKPGRRAVDLFWKLAGNPEVVEVLRTPGRNGAASTVVFRGLALTFHDRRLRVGRKYRYRVTAYDAARNSSAQTKTIVATGALLAPAPGQRITPNAPPRLTWTPVRGASYYNVQVLRRGKILSVWPSKATYQLRRTWVYNGRRFYLRPGVYHWYVWPGFGRISAARYGRLLGSSTFVVSG